MTPEQIREEKLKKITASIKAQMEADTEAGKPLNIEEGKLAKMVEEQMKLLEAASASRRSAEFEAGTDDRDDEIEKAAFKAIDAMDDKDRFTYQEKQMLLSNKRLSRNHGEQIGQRIEEFKELNDDAYLVSTMLYLASLRKGSVHSSYMDIYKKTNAYSEIQSRLKSDSELRKAMAVGSSGYGAEWIPTGFSSQVETSIELDLKVASLFRTIAMPTNPWKMPVQSSNGEGYFVSENTADEGVKHPASTPGTSSPEFNARKFAGRVLFSEEIDEDSIVNMRQFITGEMGRMIARAEESCFINGDRTSAAGVAASHMDNAGTALFTSNQDARLAFDGLRYLALHNAGTPTKDFSNADPSDTLLGNVRQKMGRYGVNPADLVWLVSINTYLKMIQLTNARTIDKYGAQATVLSGELMKYDGIPVVVSEYVFSNLNASGVYDGSTTNRSMMMLAYRPGFLVGTRGGVTLNQDLDIETDQIKLVGKKRVDFVDHYNALLAANPMVAAGYSIKTV